MGNGGNIISRKISRRKESFDFASYTLRIIIETMFMDHYISATFPEERKHITNLIQYYFYCVYIANGNGNSGTNICMMYLLSYRINQNTFSSRNLIVNWRVQYKSNTHNFASFFSFSFPFLIAILSENKTFMHETIFI